MHAHAQRCLTENNIQVSALLNDFACYTLQFARSCHFRQVVPNWGETYLRKCMGEHLNTINENTRRRMVGLLEK